MKKAERIQKLPPYLFAEIDRLKREVAARGADLINLGIGDPDTPTPAHIVARLREAAGNPANHRYPDYEGLLSFREAVAAWMKGRYGVSVDPTTEVVSLIGSKEGIANTPVAFVDPGDVVLVPDPGYPVYHIGTSFNGGATYRMPLRRENGFLPDLGAIPDEVARRAKLLWLNYPNNPTAAVAPRSFFADAIGLACDPPGGTFYVWVPVPRGLTAAGLANRCLTEAHVVVTPGNGFGDAGEGYIRLTLCSSSERLREAVERLKGLRL